MPNNWNYLAITTFIFSGCLLIIWAFEYLLKIIKAFFYELKTAISARNLDNLEEGILFALGNNPTESMDLSRINYHNAEFTHLELLQTASNLKNKGLVNINPYDQNLITLTKAGQKRAFMLQQQKLDEKS